MDGARLMDAAALVRVQEERDALVRVVSVLAREIEMLRRGLTLAHIEKEHLEQQLARRE